MSLFFHRFYRQRMTRELRLSRIAIRQEAIKNEAAEQRRAKGKTP
jgi:hypothetical protein